MAEIVSNVVAGFLANLSSEAVKALLQEVKQFKNARKEVQSLESTLLTINAVLLDAEEKQAANNQIRVWLQRLKGVLYDAEDLLDDFFTEVQRSKVVYGRNWMSQVRVFLSRENRLKYGIQMGSKLKDIRQRLDAVAKDRRQFHLEEKSQVKTKKREPSHSLMCRGYIGREKDQDVVVEFLRQSDDKKKISTIALVGHGGMGKTALTQKVFNSDDLKFDLKIWVCVSEIFDVKVIVRKILESFTEKKVEELEMDTLVGKLKRTIDGKKYLLVLDDLWNEDRNKWCHLKDLLICGTRGSKILVTTRSDGVAKAARATSKHKLEGLSKEDSWSLFQEAAFGEGQGLKNQNLASIGKRIAEKCYGVPLVILTVGRLLYQEYSEKKWREFEEDEISKIYQGNDMVMSTLRLSYNHLPSHLKRCFAYCALFPKDHWIQVKTIVQLWMATGLVQSPSKRRCLTEVGLDYFMELLHRCFFQEEKVDSCGDIWICKMHDLMHDLATSVAGDECKIFNSLEEDDVREGTRHISFDCRLNSKWKVSTQLAKVRHLQTFLLPSHDNLLENFALDEAIIHISSKFMFIRVLDLHDMGLTSVSKSIGNLKHLRYLDLSCNRDITFLPESLTMLVNLQTLKLNGCYKLRCLPRNIKQLVSLRHLCVESCSDLACMPSGLGQLVFLETLSSFVVCNEKEFKDYGRLSELKDLNNLTGVLKITRLGHRQQDKLDFEAANWKEKKDLQGLDLSWTDVDSSKQEEIFVEEMVRGLQVLQNVKKLCLCNYAGIKFPEKCFQNLISLRFSNCKKLRSIPNLGASSSLSYLDIWDCPSLNSLPRGIHSLSYLSIEGCGFHLDDMDGVMPLMNLRELSISYMEDASLPNSLLNITTLQLLRIGEMPNLKSLPDLPSSLKRLYIYTCPSLNEKVKKPRGEDWPKISHIPFIRVDDNKIQELRRP